MNENAIAILNAHLTISKQNNDGLQTELQQAIKTLSNSEVIASGKVEYNKIDDLYIVGDDFGFIIYDDDRGEQYNGKHISISINKE